MVFGGLKVVFALRHSLCLILIFFFVKLFLFLEPFYGKLLLNFKFIPFFCLLFPLNERKFHLFNEKFHFSGPLMLYIRNVKKSLKTNQKPYCL